MNKNYLQILEFNQIINTLSSYCSTDYAKEKVKNLEPFFSELQLKQALNETTNARKMLDLTGNIDLPDVSVAVKIFEIIEKGGIVFPEQLEQLAAFLSATKRVKNQLKKGKEFQNSLAFYSDNLEFNDEIIKEIHRCICANDVDSNATKELAQIRRQIETTHSQIKQKLDELLKSKKKYMSDSFVSMKNGHYTLPVKREYKNQVSGSVIAISSTGTTCFIEPVVSIKLNQKLDTLTTEEQIEKEKILYTICSLIYENKAEISTCISTIETLDFAFAKGKLSRETCAVSPTVNTSRHIKIEQGRHPLLSRDACVPLDFEIGNGINGIVITGPNTGGKTVALKLVGLFSVMAQCGLHLPCKSADICMNSNVLCDIGDGQNIAENLSTFSAHIKNVISILNDATNESLVLLDELGSGTDPAEGMGIAIAILEELRRRNCLFVATTHYSEVKLFAEQSEKIVNARMTFDKNTLKPEYKLIIGEAGESCALYIAQRLGFPQHLLKIADEQANLGAVKNNFELVRSVTKNSTAPSNTTKSKSIQKIKEPKKLSDHAKSFELGDSVTVYPDKKIGLVFETSDDMGMVGVQIGSKKQLINHKRLKMKTKASQMYPDDYDYSIVFDTVANRKARHKMSKKHRPDLQVNIDENWKEK